MTALLVCLLALTACPSFEQRWVMLPPSMALETFQAARAAAQRPSFCKWNGPDTPCRVS